MKRKREKIIKGEENGAEVKIAIVVEDNSPHAEFSMVANCPCGRLLTGSYYNGRPVQRLEDSFCQWINLQKPQTIKQAIQQVLENLAKLSRLENPKRTKRKPTQREVEVAKAFGEISPTKVSAELASLVKEASLVFLR